MTQAWVRFSTLIVLLLSTACSAGASATQQPRSAKPAVTVFPSPTAVATASPIPLSPTPQPTATPTPAPSPTPTRPEIVLSKMSQEQKIGQVMFAGLGGITVPLIEIQALLGELHLGGFILFDSNVQSPEQVGGLIRSFQETVRALDDPPLLIGIDQEGGLISRLKESKGFSEFPSPMALAANPDPAASIRSMVQAQAAELKALGINVILGPTIDVNNNPANPVIGTRAFGSQPEQVSALAQVEIEAYQQVGILAVAKHFPGHGDTTQDSHSELPLVSHDRARLDSVELMPFRAAIRSGVAGIMSAHVIFPAVDDTSNLPATLSHKVLTGLLRNELNFEGLAMTDSLEMGALAQAGYTIPKAAAAALAAGADLLLFNATPDVYRETQQLIAEQVKTGVIPQQRLDEAVRRVLRAKERFGMFAALPVDTTVIASKVGLTETRQLAQTLAGQGITLIRDTAQRLPLKPNAPLLVVETANAEGLGALLNATTLKISDQPTDGEIASVISQAAGSTVIVATSDAIYNTRQLDLVNALIAAQASVIVVATRSPYDAAYLKDAPTVLVTYGLPPPALRALADVLTGRAIAVGKLPITLP